MNDKDLAITTALFSAEQTAIVKKYAPKARTISCFEYEGVIFKGDAYIAVIEFAKNNPTGGDFYVWLQDHYTQLVVPS